jgi:nitrogen fixation/metabolism regulation signal transduction histidine kinase
MGDDPGMVDLKSLIDCLPIAIFVIDKERRVLLTNRMAEEMRFVGRAADKFQRLGDMLGCKNACEDATGCGFSGFCHFCQVKAMIGDAFDDPKKLHQFETEISVQSVGSRSFRITVIPICLDEKPASVVQACMVTMVDLTELKRKERLAAASETIGAICHEMNQPLQAIMGNAELLAHYRIDAKAHLKLNQILRDIERIKNILKQLRNLTDYKSKPYLSTRILDLEKSGSDLSKRR